MILGHWTDFRYAWVFAIAGLGGILGVFFSVPLRRSLIVEQGLKFPEGVAAAEVLTGDKPGAGVKHPRCSALGGGLAKLAGQRPQLIPDTAASSGFLGQWLACFGTNLSPALLGVGYIVGLNIGALALIGGMLSWNIAIPGLRRALPRRQRNAQRLAGASAEDVAYGIWSAQVRYLGVGAMLVGGIWALISIRKLARLGHPGGLARRARAARAALSPDTERDLPMQAILVGLVLFTVPLFAASTRRSCRTSASAC